MKRDLLIFGAGVLVGATCSFLFARLKKKEEYVEEPIEVEVHDNSPEEPIQEIPNLNAYRQILESVRAEQESPSDDVYDIHPICKDAYEELNNHDKIILYWYTHDDMLVDIYDDTSPEALDDYRALGDEWKEHIGDEEESTAYMTNEKNGRDYMIISIDGNFHDLAGYDGEETSD